MSSVIIDPSLNGAINLDRCLTFTALLGIDRSSSFTYERDLVYCHPYLILTLSMGRDVDEQISTQTIRFTLRSHRRASGALEVSMDGERLHCWDS